MSRNTFSYAGELRSKKYRHDPRVVVEKTNHPKDTWPYDGDTISLRIVVVRRKSTCSLTCLRLQRRHSGWLRRCRQCS